MKPAFLGIVVFALTSLGVAAQTKQAAKVPPSYPVDNVWSGHQVGFDVHTTAQFQYACYYDSLRNMVIAQRSLNSATWKKTILPSVIAWDSHNYVTMAIDKFGFIHVSGNMHNVPIVYFRSTSAEDISAFEKLPMTGNNEDRVTYPVFFKDKNGDLFFQYRNGGSGNGITFWNKYNAADKQWLSVFDTPLFDGEGEANAYMTEPKLAPDGYFYVVWMWRLTPVANTNHNLSCMRSTDLLHWQNLQGKPLTIPIKWSDNTPVVDPVAPWNGLINMSFKISFSNTGVPYISYHKYDNNGISQLYLARFVGNSTTTGNWKIYQLSDWKDFTWQLNRNGSLQNSTGITQVNSAGKQQLEVKYYHEKYGSGSWLVNEASMKVTAYLPATSKKNSNGIPTPVLNTNMVMHHKADNTGRYVMQWQTLPSNRDMPRTGPLPAPTPLIVYQIK